MDKVVKFFRRFPLAAGLVVLLLVLFAFTQRTAEYLRLTSQLEREEARLTELAATQSALADQIAYATSQAAVEEWARQEARWAREGDFVVIPMAPEGVTPQPATQFQPTATPATNWEAWMNWLFSTNP